MTRKVNEVTTKWKYHKVQNSLPSASNTETWAMLELGGQVREKEKGDWGGAWMRWEENQRGCSESQVQEVPKRRESDGLGQMLLRNRIRTEMWPWI